MAEEEKKYPEEKPVYESDEPAEDIGSEMKTGEREADVYSEEGREELAKAKGQAQNAHHRQDGGH